MLDKIQRQRHALTMMPRHIESWVRKVIRQSLREMRAGKRTWEQHNAMIHQLREMAVAQGWVAA